MKLLQWSVVLASIGLLGEPAAGQQDASSTRPASAAREASQAMEQWVKQLASPIFHERETATQKLLQLGAEALPHLKSAASKDVETQHRLRLLITRIETERFESLSESFLLDRDAENSYGLPGWRVFADLAGASRTSKLLFLDMIQQQPKLAELVEDAAKHSSARDRLLQATIERSLQLSEDRLRFRRPEIGDVVAILISASMFEGQLPIEINELLDTSARIVPVSTYMGRRGYGAVLRRMYRPWIPKTHQAIAFSALDLSLHYGLETGAEVSRRHLSDNFDVPTREYAIHCLARFGDRSDIPRLLPLLEDKAVCDEFVHTEVPQYTNRNIDESNEGPPGAQPDSQGMRDNEKRWVVRICDLAFATILNLNGEDPEQAFASYRRNDQFGFDSRSVAVSALESEARDALIQEWLQEFESKMAGS